MRQGQESLGRSFSRIGHNEQIRNATQADSSLHLAATEKSPPVFLSPSHKVCPPEFPVELPLEFHPTNLPRQSGVNRFQVPTRTPLERESRFERLAKGKKVRTRAPNDAGASFADEFPFVLFKGNPVNQDRVLV